MTSTDLARLTSFFRSIAIEPALDAAERSGHARFHVAH
jgi:hypothetical protein